MMIGFFNKSPKKQVEQAAKFLHRTISSKIDALESVKKLRASAVDALNGNPDNSGVIETCDKMISSRESAIMKALAEANAMLDEYEKHLSQEKSA